MKSIKPMEDSDIAQVKEFTDSVVGENYYSEIELRDIMKRSLCGDKMCSLLLKIDGQVKGVRITYPPGNWQEGKGRGLSPNLWPLPLERTAYFQSLFIAPELTGQGYGKELSLQAIGILEELGAGGVVCHSWKESPNDSSGRYLRDLGFQLIKVYPEYWKDVDYLCRGCRVKPCCCTAEEMYLELK